jgi:glycine/D-amino acid oxidase-like deaminating enzyme
VGAQDPLGRRRLLAGAGGALLAAAVGGCSVAALQPQRRSLPAPALQLAPLRASADRITQITVCTRPFRARGPRLDVERIGQKVVVHNYGHGGSGWSLSWGSSSIAVQQAMATGEREIAVIGCGAMGLTSGLLAQRAGARVTIYAKDLPPNVRSSLATGVWTPDSRICLEEHATPEFKQRWAAMARQSFKTYQTLLGLPGNPVEYFDNYFVSDQASGSWRGGPPADARPRFAELQHELVPDLIPAAEMFGPGTHQFADRYLKRNTLMMFNISSYARLLLSDFLANGGKIEIAEFHAPAELAGLREKTLINATGYGARALFGDESIIPVRGQLARMIPEPGVGYGLFYKSAAFVPRRDGWVFQVIGDDDYYGYNDDSTAPDRTEAELAVNTIAGLFQSSSGGVKPV